MFNIIFFLLPNIRGVVMMVVVVGGVGYIFFPCVSRFQHPLLPQKRLCTAVLLGGLLTP